MYKCTTLSLSKYTRQDGSNIVHMYVRELQVHVASESVTSNTVTLTVKYQ